MIEIERERALQVTERILLPSTYEAKPLILFTSQGIVGFYHYKLRFFRGIDPKLDPLTFWTLYSTNQE